MSCARPVIISDTLDHPLLVTPGENGFLFDYRDPADLAEKIKIFASLPLEARREMGFERTFVRGKTSCR